MNVSGEDRNHDDTSTGSWNSEQLNTEHFSHHSNPPATTSGGGSGSLLDVEDEKEFVAPSRPQGQTGNPPTPAQSAYSGDVHEDARFVCNICLDPVRDSVVTVCGHLYCWPCLFRWLNIGQTTCPVCKAGVTKENVIPLYLQGKTEDPRVKQQSSEANVPNRPSAQRPAPQPTTQGNARFTGGGGGLAFSAGIGFFPSLFGLQFQNFAPPPNTATPRAPLTADEIQQNFVSQSLLVLGIFVLFCLMLV